MHLIVARRELVERHPSLMRDLMEMFEEAKRIAWRYYDDSDYSQSKTFLAVTISSWPFFQFQYSAKSSSKCDRFRIKISDAFTAGVTFGTKSTGRGFALSSIMLEVEQKSGLRRLQANQTL
jgi:hypothetical protein